MFGFKKLFLTARSFMTGERYFDFPKNATASELVDLILDKSIKFKMSTKEEIFWSEVHYKSTCGRVHLQVDYPSTIGGTFSYLRVDGVDRSKDRAFLVQLKSAIMDGRKYIPSNDIYHDLYYL